MQTTLIITTYNWVEALNVTLQSVMQQSVLPDEIIIADDGSGQETIDFVEEWKQKSKVPIIHSWQEDRGFRAAASRNKSIAKSHGDYIIMVDGDLFLHKDFIKGHLRHARKGQFCMGTRVIMGKEKSQEIIEDITKGQNVGFFSKGILKNPKNTICCNGLSDVFSHKTTSYKKVRSANMSCYKKDLVCVNGFNEAFIGWGREDTEIVVRLLNAGIHRKNIKFNANVLHLYHPENSREMLAENDAILAKTIMKNLICCEKGIDQYL